MAAVLLQALIGQHPDHVRAPDGGEAMGDGEGGAALAELLQGALYQKLRLVVQRAGGLIQQQDGRILQKDPGDGQALLLPAGQLHPPLAHMGVIALRQRHDKLMGARLLGGLLHLLQGGAGLAVNDVVKDGAGEQVDLLLHGADGAPEAFQGKVPHIMPVYHDLPAGHIIKAGNQVAQRGFAGAAGPHQGHALPRRHLQVDLVQHKAGVILIAEADILKGDLPLHLA